MGVTAEMLRPFLEGWTVKQIIDAKRLFICDYKILEDLPTKNDRPVSDKYLKSIFLVEITVTDVFMVFLKIFTFIWEELSSDDVLVASFQKEKNMK